MTKDLIWKSENKRQYFIIEYWTSYKMMSYYWQDKNKLSGTEFYIKFREIPNQTHQALINHRLNSDHLLKVNYKKGFQNVSTKGPNGLPLAWSKWAKL